MRSTLLFAITLSGCVHAQALKLPASFDKVTKKASNTVDVSLDGILLQTASAFLDPEDRDEAVAKKLISKLKGLYVHHFEFNDDAKGGLSEADLAALKDQLKSPPWSRVVNVHNREDKENVEVFLKKDGDKVGGLVVLAAQENELTIVDIDGPLEPKDLIALGGHLGIPRLDAIRKHAKARDEDD